jgi:hypothetical protein
MSISLRFSRVTNLSCQRDVVKEVTEIGISVYACG